MADRTCTVEGCSTVGKIARGMCTRHYKRWQVHGGPFVSHARPISYCVAPECEMRVEGLGLCRKHLRRQRKLGTFDLPVKPTTCSIDSCDALRRVRGWCRKHYMRWYYHGDPMTVLPNPMNLPSTTFTLCKVRGCPLRHSAKGLCKRHYGSLWHRAWRRANPEKASLRDQRRRVLLRGAPINDLTVQEWREIKAAYHHRCAYCHKRRPLTIDHVVPLVRKGSHTASNVVPACRPCNSRKGTKTAPKYQPLLF